MLIRTIYFLLITLFIGCSGGDIIEQESIINNIAVTMKVVKGDLPGSLYLKLSGDAMKLIRETIVMPDNSAYGEIARLNQDRGPIDVSEEAYQLLQLAVQYQKETNNVWDPCLGEVEQMWKYAEPSEERLDIAMARVLKTKINLLDGNRVELEGEGTIDLRRLVIGWAVDGAAEIMISGGIESAMITAGSVYRFWGEPPEGAWSLDLAVPNRDSAFYRIKPLSGGLCIVNMGNALDSMNVMIDSDGYLVEDKSIMAVWSSSASKSTVYAETFYTIERPQIYDILKRQDSIGMFILFPDTLGYVGESNRLMSPWISQY